MRNVSSSKLIALCLASLFSFFVFYAVTRYSDKLIPLKNIVTPIENVLNLTTTLKLPRELFEFFQVAKKYKLELIFIEPCRLWGLLSLKFQIVLQQKQIIPAEGLMCHKTKSGKEVYSFAVRSVDVHKMSPSFERHLSKNGFDLSSYFDSKDKQLTHIIVSKKKREPVIHVTIFSNRSNFLVVKPISNFEQSSEHSLSPFDLKYGLFAAAFDEFNTMLISFKSYKIQIPRQITQFLFQRKYSKFIECDKKRADNVTNYYPELTKYNLDMDSKVASSIEAVKLLMNKLLIPIWLDGGTLLGWNRQCGVIPYDHDMDVASFGIFNNNTYNLTKEMRNMLPEPWFLIEIYGFPWLAYQLRIWNFESFWGIDIFWVFEDEDTKDYYFGYHPHPGERFCRLRYSRKAFDSICSGELNGLKVLVPCDPSIIHEAEYGAKWMIPSKKFGINNGKCTDYWLPRESSFAYQCTSVRSGIRESPKVQANGSVNVDRINSTITPAMVELADEYFSLCQDIKRKRTGFWGN